MIVFVVSGLWHGANFTFIIWGTLHGIYQVIGDLTRDIKHRINLRIGTNTKCVSYKLLQMSITFLLTCFAWIFFRSDNITRAFDFIRILFTKFDPWSLFDGELYTLGLDRTEFNILAVSMVILFIVDLIRRRNGVRLDVFLRNENLWFRWIVLIGLIMGVIIFGAYGPVFDAQQFIYFQF
jgi:D-alanyl-lipoteichoic acid acyltransferase DltB (MBOAT superfamily)